PRRAPEAPVGQRRQPDQATALAEGGRAQPATVGPAVAAPPGAGAERRSHRLVRAAAGEQVRPVAGQRLELRGTRQELGRQRRSLAQGYHARQSAGAASSAVSWSRVMQVSTVTRARSSGSSTAAVGLARDSVEKPTR